MEAAPQAEPVPILALILHPLSARTRLSPPQFQAPKHCSLNAQNLLCSGKDVHHALTKLWKPTRIATRHQSFHWCYRELKRRLACICMARIFSSRNYRCHRIVSIGSLDGNSSSNFLNWRLSKEGEPPWDGDKLFINGFVIFPNTGHTSIKSFEVFLPWFPLPFYSVFCLFCNWLLEK